MRKLNVAGTSAGITIVIKLEHASVLASVVVQIFFSIEKPENPTKTMKTTQNTES